MAWGHGHLPSITQLGREGPWIQMQAVWLLGLCSQPLHCHDKPDPEALSTHQSHPAKQWDSNPALSSSGLLSTPLPRSSWHKRKAEKGGAGGWAGASPGGAMWATFPQLGKEGIKPDILLGLSSSRCLRVYRPELEAEGPRRPLLCAAASYHWGGSSEVCCRAAPDAARSTCSRKARSQGLWDAALHSCPGNIKGHKQKG